MAALNIRCYYCGTQKKIDLGTAVKLSCDHCSSSKVILERPATFRCLLCGETFSLPAGRQVEAFHGVEDCRGRSLILMDYE